MTEETNRDVVWPIGLALSAVLHAGGLYYIISHNGTPGATDVPTPAISVSLVPDQVLQSMSDTGTIASAGSGMVGEGGEAAQESEQTSPLEETQPVVDAQAETRVRAEEDARANAATEARERAEAESRSRAQAEAKAALEAQAVDRIARAAAEAKERAELEARALADARDRAEAEAREKAEAERRTLAEAERRKAAEAERARDLVEKERERRAEAARQKTRQARAAGSASNGESQSRSRQEAGRVSAKTGELLNYKARVEAHIARHLPRGRTRATGQIVFRVRLTEAGGVIGVSVVQSSGNAQLDQVALSAVRQAAPYPRAPEGVSVQERIFDSSFIFR